jgi:SulP family sulfate permease
MAYMDQSGLYAMEDVLQDLRKKNIQIFFVSLLKQPRYMMERIDIIPDLISEDYIFENFNDCTKWIKNNFKKNNQKNV